MKQINKTNTGKTSLRLIKDNLQMQLKSFVWSCNPNPPSAPHKGNHHSAVLQLLPFSFYPFYKYVCVPK